jgi:hypothetical protein
MKGDTNFMKKLQQQGLEMQLGSVPAVTGLVKKEPFV